MQRVGPVAERGAVDELGVGDLAVVGDVVEVAEGARLLARDDDAELGERVRELGSSGASKKKKMRSKPTPKW